MRAGEEKNGVFACILDELLLAAPHSNLGHPLCACLVGWYPPSRGVWKQLLLGIPPHGRRGRGRTDGPEATRADGRRAGGFSARV